MDHAESDAYDDTALPPDTRPFSQQRPGAHCVAFAPNPDRLVPSLALGAGSIDVSWPIERRETWYCDAAMNPRAHPHLAPYLYATPQAAHAKSVSAVSIGLAGLAWAVTDVSVPSAI